MLRSSIAVVALLAGSTLALADPNNSGPGGNGAGGGGAMMQHSGGAMKGGTTEGKGGPSMKGSDARSAPSEKMTGNRSAAESGPAAGEGRSKGDPQRAGNEDRGEKMRNRQAEEKSDRSLKNDERSNRADRNDSGGAKTSDQARDNSHRDRAATGASEGTEGKARPKGSLTNISSEQKTRVRAAFREHRVTPARNIGVSVNVGVVIPRSVHIYPVPAAIVTIVPDYSGYEYFMIDETHVAIVDPDTLEVVDIIVVA